MRQRKNKVSMLLAIASTAAAEAAEVVWITGLKSRNEATELEHQFERGTQELATVKIQTAFPRGYFRQDKWVSAKKKNAENRKLIYNKAKHYTKEYADKDNELVCLKSEARLKGEFFYPV